MKASLGLRGATTRDSSYILWLEDVCMKDYAVALRGTWRPSSKLDEFDVGTHQIIELEGDAIGCVAFERSAEFVELKRLFIAPDFQNRGFGAAVLGRVMEFGRAAGLPVRLSVLKTNPALNFYLRAGFSVVRETSERRIMVGGLDAS